MKQFIILLFSISFSQINFAQDTTLNKPDSLNISIAKDTIPKKDSSKTEDLKVSIKVTISEDSLKTVSVTSPYKTSFIKDGLIITGAVAATLLGYELIKNKRGLTMEELAAKTKDKLPFFDKGNAGYYSEQADKDSYILFEASYVLPALVMLIDKSEHKMIGQLIALYGETIVITGAMYTMTAGLVYRSRPFVYGDKAPLDKRLFKGSQRSFYGGHVATTAASTFFIAKVFHDFHPHSKLRPFLWIGATGLSALMGYWRYRSGYHFLSDNVVSFIVGAATGILIPQWHKRNVMKNFSIVPVTGEQQGIGLVYKF